MIVISLIKLQRYLWYFSTCTKNSKRTNLNEMDLLIVEGGKCRKPIPFYHIQIIFLCFPVEIFSREPRMFKKIEFF